MPILSGSEAERFWKALLDAFEVDEFRRLLRFTLGQRLDDLTLASSFQSRVFDVIETAERNDWMLRLIAAACDARPADAALHEIASEAGLTAAPSTLEKLIRAAVPFLDVAVWRTRLSELEGQVCRVEMPTTFGTGFLVAPDLVLTNYHVIAGLAGGGDHRAARLRFDYKRAADGTEIHQGTMFELADDWLVAGRTPSAVDLLPSPGNRLPTPDELDFALLRVKGRPGEQSSGFAANLPGALPRGWIKSSQVAASGTDAEHTLFILQHPQGDPLQLAFGASVGLNANGTRLRYEVNTEPGSSGSPCLNANLDLVALHHAGDPNWLPRYNAGVPVTAIRDYLATSDLATEVFAA
jgi:hypothetical protein